MSHCGSTDARALRLVLALSAGDDDSFVSSLREADDCPTCLRELVGALAAFGADRVKRSPTPERWDRWLVARIAEELDAAEGAEA